MNAGDIWKRSKKIINNLGWLFGLALVLPVAWKVGKSVKMAK